MTTPIRHSIELYAMRELHLFVPEDTLELALPLLISPVLAVVLQLAVWLLEFSCKVLEFYHILENNPAI